MSNKMYSVGCQQQDESKDTDQKIKREQMQR